jgi:hypothetical protein
VPPRTDSKPEYRLRGVGARQFETGDENARPRFRISGICRGVLSGAQADRAAAGLMERDAPEVGPDHFPHIAVMIGTAPLIRERPRILGPFADYEPNDPILTLMRAIRARTL